MRLPYKTEFKGEAEQAVVERIQQRRGPAGLQQLDLTLLHSAPLADGWNAFLGAIRERTSLPPTLREIVICRVAVLNRAWYEWEHHAPLLRAAGEINEEAIQHILTSPPATRCKWANDARGQAFTTPSAGISSLRDPASQARKNMEEIPAVQIEPIRTQGTGKLPAKYLAVMSYTDAMTNDVSVSDIVFERLQEYFNEQEIVEITATIAAYNCVSRFLVALDVGEKNAQQGPAYPGPNAPGSSIISQLQ
ncbi:uncharacterized protein K452DRAFT_291604 [Aplosporella prunicola CBS 121167]|uniref:Carboxymuconolactone decarboxylase-like domain-containing protein n=1 Tax=Aplosporella prunicola CBS 121167 TaxID=1176127 RepID=A0A6A6B478_9PEZI|nr:uncharacterized protein K452DRAFT_291604 [Aplosporella prunicola CBS 121167]KAF2137551.1 hypothetical protein K452DRAFT_291604 [Aplosporella prunicola CBS 121167]